jgi:hypothetical protein
VERRRQRQMCIRDRYEIKQTRQNTLFCPPFKSTIRFMSFQIYQIINLTL